MIEVRVRFWTDKIAEEKNKVIPGHAWTGGVVMLERNASHGIAPLEPLPFNSLADLPGKIEKLLIAQGVTLHLSSRERKYLVSE